MTALDIHPLGWLMLALWVGTFAAVILLAWASRANDTHYPEMKDETGGDDGQND